VTKIPATHDGLAEEVAVDHIAWARGVPAGHGPPGHRADRGAKDDIAQPVGVGVHPSVRRPRRESVGHEPNGARVLRSDAGDLVGDGGGESEGSGGVAGGKRFIRAITLDAVPPTTELDIPDLVRGMVGTRPTDRGLEHSRDHSGDTDRLECAQPDLRHVWMTRDAPTDPHPGTEGEHPGVTPQIAGPRHLLDPLEHLPLRTAHR